MTMMATTKRATLSPVRPNAALAAEYRKRLNSAITAMSEDVLAEIRAAYAETPPEAAQDASPARTIADIIARLRTRWEAGFRTLSDDLARYFAMAAKDRTDAQLQAALRKAGFTVRFRMSRTVNDIVQAFYAENVALIRSIPAQYFTQIEGMVMRSVQVGGDLGSMSQSLREQYGVTKRRAALISRDQTRKAMAVVERARQQEIGITEAYWKHSAGGKHPRPTHVRASKDGVIYEVEKGWFDPAQQKFIWPGTSINCRCFAKAIIPGLAKFQKAA